MAVYREKIADHVRPGPERRPRRSHGGVGGEADRPAGRRDVLAVPAVPRSGGRPSNSCGGSTMALRLPDDFKELLEPLAK